MNNTTKTVALIAAVAITAILVAYIGGRMWTQGAADQLRSEFAAQADARAAEKVADAEKMWADSAKIEKGMTEEDVRAIMGWQHEDGRYEGNKLFWQWISQDATVDVIVDFTDGTVTEIQRTRD